MHRLLVREGTVLVGIIIMTDVLRGFATRFGHWRASHRRAAVVWFAS